MPEANVFPETAPKDPVGLYLDLMKRCLLSWIYPDWPSTWTPVNTTQSSETRGEGRDWPARAHTMIGLKRLQNLQECVETALRDNIPGDLLEAGVWRGGAAIFMRAVLKAHGVTNRRVWLADSFAGLPPPNPEKYPHDTGLDFDKYSELAVSLEQVQDNFRRYGLLDEQVGFLKGWFRDTLPQAPVKQLAVLRLDGDLYESTMDVLTNLYDKLAPGGFLIVDDYFCIPACARAVDDFRARHGIDEPITKVDWSGCYWRKGARLSNLVLLGWTMPEVRSATVEATSLPAVLQPKVLFLEDERDWPELHPPIGCRIEDLHSQYRNPKERKPVPITVATLVFSPETLDEHLSRTLAQQDVEGEVIVEHNRDNHTTLARFYNRVIDTARHDHILFVHPDVEMSPWGISTLLGNFDRIPDCGALGLVGSTLQGLIVWSDRRRLPREVSALDACIVMIDRRHGLRFDDETFNTFHAVVEDYCLQTQAAGRKTYVAPGITLAHFGATTYEKPDKAQGWVDELMHYVWRLEGKWPGMSFCVPGCFDSKTQQLRHAFDQVNQQLLNGRHASDQVNQQLLDLQRWVDARRDRTFILPDSVVRVGRALRNVARRTGLRRLLPRRKS